MIILLWITVAMAAGSAVGMMMRAADPRMSKPSADIASAILDLALAAGLLWAIARGWTI